MQITWSENMLVHLFDEVQFVVPVAHAIQPLLFLFPASSRLSYGVPTSSHWAYKNAMHLANTQSIWEILQNSK